MTGSFTSSLNFVTIDTINVFKNNKNMSLTTDNVISHDWVQRVEGLHYLFTQTLGGKYVPYNSSKGSYCDLVLKLNFDIDKILLYAYANEGSAKYVDISYSSDNIIYEPITKVTFPTWNTGVYVNISLFKHLIYRDNKYFNISDDNYDLIEKNYNNLVISVENNLKDIFDQKSLLLEELFKEKELNNEIFKPIEKFDNFKIRRMRT